MILLAIFAAYSALHAYAFLKTRAALRLHDSTAALLALFMAGMVFAPNLVRVLEKGGYGLPARFLAAIGYGWMGLLFLFVLLHLTADLLRLSARRFAPAFCRKTVPRTRFFVVLSLALALFLYGLYEAGDIRLRHISLRTPGIPEAAGRLRIVHMTDVHLNLIHPQAHIEKIAELITEANPDILVSTGDLVDGQMGCLSRWLEPLRAIEPRLGKYAVTGNHEFLSGLGHALELTEKAGFTVLRNESVTILEAIAIAGVDDPAVRGPDPHGAVSERDVLSDLPEDVFVLLLKHRPVVEQGSPGLFDLQLSGHTHGGQIFPLHLAARLFFPRGPGLHVLSGRSSLYIGPGAGACGPPIRILSPPVITVIDLVHEA